MEIELPPQDRPKVVTLDRGRSSPATIALAALIIRAGGHVTLSEQELNEVEGKVFDAKPTVMQAGGLDLYIKSVEPEPPKLVLHTGGKGRDKHQP